MKICASIFQYALHTYITRTSKFLLKIYNETGKQTFRLTIIFSYNCEPLLSLIWMRSRPTSTSSRVSSPRLFPFQRRLCTCTLACTIKTHAWRECTRQNARLYTMRRMSGQRLAGILEWTPIFKRAHKRINKRTSRGDHPCHEMEFECCWSRGPSYVSVVERHINATSATLAVVLRPMALWCFDEVG